MAYFSKETVLAAYKIVSTFSADHKQGATQTISAIRYALALDEFHKQQARPCNTENRADRELFETYVGEIVDVCTDYYTPDFYRLLKKHNGDYNVGSNFYSVGAVKDSKINPAITIQYPRRTTAALFTIRAALLSWDPVLIENIADYLLEDNIKTAFVVWLLRNANIDPMHIYDSIEHEIDHRYSHQVKSGILLGQADFINTLTGAIPNYALLDNTPATLSSADIKELFPDVEMETEDEIIGGVNKVTSNFADLPRQKIVYGAPGTGKSHGINNDTKGQIVYRTTFHPDSTYSSFVGAYKPTMGDPEPIYGFNRGRTVTAKDKLGNDVLQQRIEYTFIKQAFLKAYLKAWHEYTHPVPNVVALAAAGAAAPAAPAAPAPEEIPIDNLDNLDNLDNPNIDPNIRQREPGGNVGAAEAGKFIKPVFLIIEEINRGHCAQIFGDIFQLLDRENEGDWKDFSTYPIEADTDIQKAIKEAFENEDEYKLDTLNIDALIPDYKSPRGNVWTLSQDVKEGYVMLLPNNLYIWATMNTSDQSLFPMDSAFKRRWEWKYVPIEKGVDKDKNGLDYRIKFEDVDMDWWTFLRKINKAVYEATHSEDKQMGYFFVKSPVIDEKLLVNKVIFYLWNDVFKERAAKMEIFKDEKGNRYTFRDLFSTGGEVDKTLAAWFVKRVDEVYKLDDEPVPAGPGATI